MSKPYQHHDETADQGKAEPKPKQPTSRTTRRRIGRHTNRILNYDVRQAIAQGKTTEKTRCCLNGHGNGRSAA